MLPDSSNISLDLDKIAEAFDLAKLLLKIVYQRLPKFGS